MTVGELSARTGLSRKAIRELEGRGLIYTVGRSESNYRLFDESSLWCVRTIEELRGLGFTLAQIEQLHGCYRAGDREPIEAQFNLVLESVRARLVAQISEIQQKIDRIDAFGSSSAADLATTEGWREDPCLSR
jgi:MerR family transcriptional regulator, copper efflux regulator